jgi:DNA polymerase-3 subunit epsilon
VHAGLSYTDNVDSETSLIICNESRPEQGKGFQARELRVPFITDTDFMSRLDTVVGGSTVEEFTDVTLAGDQFALF